MHLACSTEFLDSQVAGYLSDFISWGAVGARTSESQIHRELASGLPCPIGFKNGTTGDIQIAVDACVAARKAYKLMGVKVGSAGREEAISRSPSTRVWRAGRPTNSWGSR